MNVIEKRYPRAHATSWCAALVSALVAVAWADAPTKQASVPLTPQTQAVVENLRRIADAGQFVYSWTHPWQETDPAFRAADGDGWRPKEPGEFTFSSRFNNLTGEEPVPGYDARLEEIASFLDGLKGTDGMPIPVVVRLFHECEDDWQWWGLGSASVKEYVVGHAKPRDGTGRTMGYLPPTGR